MQRRLSLSPLCTHVLSLFISFSSSIHDYNVSITGKFAVYSEKSRKLNDNVVDLSARLKSSDIYVQRAELQVKYILLREVDDSLHSRNNIEPLRLKTNKFTEISLIKSLVLYLYSI